MPNPNVMKWTYFGFEYCYYALTINGPGGASYAAIARIPAFLMNYAKTLQTTSGGFTVSAQAFQVSKLPVPITSLQEFSNILSAYFQNPALTYIPSLVKAAKNTTLGGGTALVGYFVGSNGASAPSQPTVINNTSVTNNMTVVDQVTCQHS